MATNPQQQQLTQQQQQLRLTMQLQQQQQQQQQNAQQATMSMTAQPTHSQPGSQLTVSCISQSVPTQVPLTVTASQQASVSVSSITQQITHPQAQGSVPPSNMQTQQLVPHDRTHIWQGIVEWIEEAKTDLQKQTRLIPCQISLNTKKGESCDLKADTWPDKLLMQLMPKTLIGNIGNIFLKNSTSVLFHPTPCEALESLTKMMTNGFAGCVHFTTAPSSPTCDIKVLILLYTTERKAYLGFMPNDQTAFVDRLRKLIQQQKTTHATIKQEQVRMPNAGPSNTIPAPMPTTGTQGGILMSQTNTMAMGGGQITQNVVSSNAPPQTLTFSSGPQTQMNMQNSGISGPQSNTGAGGMIGQQRPTFDDIELARHLNLLKIQHGSVPPSNMQTQQLVPRYITHIWQGIVEWIEKAKTDSQKQTRHVPCQILANRKIWESYDLKADTWPDKLLMQLMPKTLIGNIGNIFLKNSKSVLFHPTPCEALESLTKMMTNGFAGCVYFTTTPSSPTCDIKVLILLYYLEKKAYLGFIPNDQTAFVDRLRKVIQQQKTTHATIKQGQVRMPNAGPSNTIPAPMPTTGTQGGILMSQTNTMAMGGGQITQNVVFSNAPPQTLTFSSGPQTQMNMQNSGISGPQSNTGAGGMISQQRPTFDDIELARHLNLLKIQHGSVSPSNMQTQQLVLPDRTHIWQGIVEWIEKAKTDSQKQTRHVPCQISINTEIWESCDLKADTWPDKLLMQLVSITFIGYIDTDVLQNSKYVLFHPTPCEALESLTKMMTNGFAGCVYFTTTPSSPNCDIKVLILLYNAETKAFQGFIPNNQTAFVDRLRKVSSSVQKTTHATIKQGQVRMPNAGPSNTIPAPMPTTGTQGGILMSQTNTMAMGGGQITQNVVSSNAPPQTLTFSIGPQTQMNMQNSGISGPQSYTGAGGMIGPQQPPFGDIEFGRHLRLLEIQHERQTLEAAQKQKAQYKSQLEVNIQQNLELAQQQEMQYKQQLEAQQAQRGINPAAMSNQQPNTQRLMRSVSTNNLGLRHFLQQPQPQYRQVFGVQQQMVGLRGQIATRPNAW